MRPADWTETASQDNATATATKAAETGKRHVLMYVQASFSVSSVSKLLTIKRGTTTVAAHYIHGADVIPLELRGNVNEAVSAELAASGTAGQIGKVNLVGYTE